MQNHINPIEGQSGHVPAGFCPHCGYAIDPGICPECGNQVDVPIGRPRRAWPRRCIAPAIVLVLLVGGGFSASYLRYLSLRYFTPREALINLYVTGNSAAWRAVRDTRSTAYKREDKILTQICDEMAAAPNHPWAGTYRIPFRFNRFGNVSLQRGDATLYLSPSGRYFWQECECQGCSNIVDWGRMTDVSSAEVTLTSDFPEPWVGPPRMMTFRRIHLRGQHLMVPKGTPIPNELRDARKSATILAQALISREAAGDEFPWNPKK